MVEASRVLHHAFWDRFDQVRGITPMAAGYTSLVDTYEGISYALLKAKVAQLFGMVVKRAGEDSAAPIAETVTAETSTETTDEDEQENHYEVNFGDGPFYLELDPGDEAEFLENDSPSAGFKEFMVAVIGMALKSLDIPFCFYDEAWTNFFGSKAALALYLKSCKSKRDDNQDILRRLTYWRLKLFILDGLLELPRGSCSPTSSSSGSRTACRGGTNQRRSPATWRRSRPGCAAGGRSARSATATTGSAWSTTWPKRRRTSARRR